MVKSKVSFNALAIAMGLVLAFALSVGAFSGNASALEAADADVSLVGDELVAVDPSAGPRYLADGTYVFNADKNKSLLVDVSGSSKKAGAKVIMAEDSASDSDSQKWELSWDDQYGAYRIKNVKSGKYLTAKAAKAGKKMVSQAKKSANNKKQLWKLEKDGSAYRFVSCANSSIGLGTADGKAEAGSYITTQKAKARKFKFYVLPVDPTMPASGTAATDLDGTFANVSLASKSGLVIGVASNGTNNGDPAELSESSGSQSQKWYLKAIDASNGIYAIVNLGSGKALQVANKGRHIGADVVQYKASTSNKAQQWWVRKKGKNYSFTSCFNGLTLRSANSKAGANMSVALESKISSTRAFRLAAVEPLDDGNYQVSTWKKPNLALGVAGGNVKKGKQLQLSNRQATQLWQKFVIEKKGDCYAIRSVTSNRFIGVSGGKVVQGALGTASPSDSELWSLEWNSNGFVLKNKATNSYLNASAKKGAKLAASKSGTKLVFAKCHLIEDGTYFLSRGGNSNKVMGIDQANAKNENAKVGVFKKANSQNLKFNVTFVSGTADNEIYKIASTYSGKYLTAAGSKLVQRKKSNATTQRWTAVVTSTGMVAFKNVKTKKSMTFGSKGMSATKYSASKSSRFRVGFTATTSLTPDQVRAYDMLNATFSNTNYAITADLSNHRVRVWKRASASDPWTLKYDWICSNGAWATPTPAVNVLSTGAKRFENPMYRPDGTIYGSSFWYMTYIADGKYFHTPLYRKGSMTRYADARMGRFISHGCVRVQTNNAIWIYKNIKRGTRIITYY